MYIHRCNTTFGKCDVRFRADCLWNNLPLSLKKITSERINNLKIVLSERLYRVHFTRPMQRALSYFILNGTLWFIVTLYRRPALLDSYQSFCMAYQPATVPLIFMQPILFMFVFISVEMANKVTMQAPAIDTGIACFAFTVFENTSFVYIWPQLQIWLAYQTWTSFCKPKTKDIYMQILYSLQCSVFT